VTIQNDHKHMMIESRMTYIHDNPVRAGMRQESFFGKILALGQAVGQANSTQSQR